MARDPAEASAPDSGPAPVAGVAALAFLLAVTAAWWALALWPAGERVPEWLLRARAVCFNAGASGLPDASGWLLLIGQPIGMLAAMWALWGGSIRAGLSALARVPAGRLALLLAASGISLGLGAAGARVLAASGGGAFAAPVDARPPDTYPRLDRPAPELGLVDQRGRRLERASLAGRPALVTFAFGHCASVCPSLVRQTLEARERALERARADGSGDARVPRVVVVTLDPWRDTPARLGPIARQWQLPDDAFVLSGGVDEVGAVLDAWNAVRQRDPRTGEVSHPPLVYVLDASGRIAYAASGGVAVLTELVERS